MNHTKTTSLRLGLLNDLIYYLTWGKQQVSNNLEWRPIPKFPGYEVSATLLVRYISTKRIIPQRHTIEGNKVLIHRNGWNTEVFVHEQYLSAFPEKRDAVYVKKVA